MAAYSAISLIAIDEPVNLVFDLYVFPSSTAPSISPGAMFFPSNHFPSLTTSLSTWLLAGWISVLAIKAVSSSEQEEDDEC